MKKLTRFAVQDYRADPVGTFIKHDEAMQALADRQSAFDIVNGQRERLQTCVEVGDRIARALWASS